MRCLYIAHRAPFPPKGGAKVRAFNCIRHLHESGHDVVVATLSRNAEEAADIEGLRPYCADIVCEPVTAFRQALRMVALLPTSRPSTMGYFHSPALHRRIADAHARHPFDLVICHSSSVGPYAEVLSDVAKVMDFVDMDSQKWLLYAEDRPWPLSMGYWLEGRKLEREEARLARAFDCSIVVTEGEHAILHRLAPDARTDWVPNGVDVEEYAPSDEPYDPNVISFVGRFDYFPNVQGAQWFCDHVMPALNEALPDMTLQLVGANPTADVRRLAQRPNVHVTGTVPEVQPYVRKSLATVAPLRIARGVQNKILESMAMGVPAIVSEESAKGVDAIPGKHILACRSARDYVDAIADLNSSKESRANLAVAGRDRAVNYLSWPRVMERMDSVIDTVT